VTSGPWGRGGRLVRLWYLPPGPAEQDRATTPANGLRVPRTHRPQAESSGGFRLRTGGTRRRCRSAIYNGLDGGPGGSALAQVTGPGADPERGHIGRGG